MLRHIYTFFLIALIGLGATSCVDELPMPDIVTGDGEAVLSASVDFHPMINTKNNALGASRGQAGDMISEINNLTVFLYDIEGKLVDIYDKDDLKNLTVYEKNSEGANTSMPNDAVGGNGTIAGKPVQAEESTARADFKITGIQFGKYYIYAVANMGDLTETPEKTLESRKKFATVQDLQNTQVEWNVTDLSQNSQMFGYFTAANTGTDGCGGEKSSGFSADLITVGKEYVNIHSWLKRAASKVTIVYDGSQLKNDIWIYIKSVTIKDIPIYCKIGAENKIEVAEGQDPKEVMIETGDCILYNTDGELPAGSTAPESYLNWLEITNNPGLKGAVTKEGDTEVVHSEYNQALYFYENCQGNYPGNPYYYKPQIEENVGFMPAPGQYDYKDNVPYGTYIEVEAYYISKDPADVTEGNIKYRYMLGQNDDYDYNAIRNHHYKLTLGFRGYANQPDWHIEYIEPDNTIFIDPTYYISYGYNHRAEFPVRIRGDIEELDIEIIENNWAPYDVLTGTVPAATVNPPEGNLELPFRWNKQVYDNVNGNYYYGLQQPWTRNGQAHTTFSAEAIAQGVPEKVTPIWAGFLALQVPDNLTATLLAGSSWVSTAELKNYFYNNHQNYRTYTEEDLNSFNTAYNPNGANNAVSKTVGTGNNATTIIRGGDGSITVNIPMWTRPKSMLGVSGFTGNNPYETYRRKAMVKITATFKKGAGATESPKVVKYLPVFQVRRMVNPKGIWFRGTSDSSQSFTALLAERDGAATSNFHIVKSEGAWKAYVKTTNGNNFLTLKGGFITSGDTIIGATGSEIKFDINFKPHTDQAASNCAIVEVEYHGLTCNHSIFVRQGYNEPLQVVSGGATWSTFSLYRCIDSPAFMTQWNPTEKNYIDAELTKNPLTLGTLFKRANYNGILIYNNERSGLGALEAPGWNTKFLLSNGDEKSWGEIEGLAYARNYSGWSPDLNWNGDNIHVNFEWGRFKVEDTDLKYKLPSNKDFKDLIDHCDFGIGSVYTDGATTTELTTDGAFGFEDSTNDGNDDSPIGTETRGIRGVIVYNPLNANQLFFSVGARGMGRRTIMGFTATSWNSFGTLRYSGTMSVLDENNNANNPYRPIPFNMPAVPGAIYWIDKMTNAPGQDPDSHILGWEMNYFDLNFNGYGSYPAWSFDKYPGIDGYNQYNFAGDALPIKLVVDPGN